MEHAINAQNSPSKLLQKKKRSRKATLSEEYLRTSAYCFWFYLLCLSTEFLCCFGEFLSFSLGCVGGLCNFKYALTRRLYSSFVTIYAVVNFDKALARNRMHGNIQPIARCFLLTF